MPFIDLPDHIPGLRARAQSNQPKPWYRITNQTADEAEVMLYNEVGGWLGATADEFIDELRGITAPKILLRLNSPGGLVTEGIAIANALRSHPANVTVQVDGIAASIASVIAMAGDHVRVMPNALLMVHEASGLCVGGAAEMAKMAEVLNKISDNIAGAYAARAGGTEAEWREVMREETWYRGEEAVAAGLADECIAVPKRGEGDAAPEGEPEMRQSFDFAAYGYQGPQRPEEKSTLTIGIGSALGEQIADALRAAVAPTPPEPATSVPAADEPASMAEGAEAAVTDNPNPQTPAPPQQVVVQVDPAALAAALREAGRTAPIEEPAPTPEPAPVPSLAALAAHLTKPARPAAPTWRDRVAHLTPPSSATTQPAP